MVVLVPYPRRGPRHLPLSVIVVPPRPGRRVVVQTVQLVLQDVVRPDVELLVQLHEVETLEVVGGRCRPHRPALPVEPHEPSLVRHRPESIVAVLHHTFVKLTHRPSKPLLQQQTLFLLHHI